MMKKDKAKNQGKKKQDAAVRASARRRLNRKAGDQVRRYLKKTKRPKMPESVEEDDGSLLVLDDQISIPLCEGVGDCCKDRALYVEPSDVWRIMHNERAREKFGLEITSDLYPEQDTGEDKKKDIEKGKKYPLAYFVDKKTHLPFCAVVRVEDESGSQVCPFLETTEDGPVCVLGEDRLTQCKPDPVLRVARLDKKRRLSGWTYSLIDQPCIGCKSADVEEERESTVEEWLMSKGMEDRFIDSDLFHGFLGWMGQHASESFHWYIATRLLFDWDRFMLEDLEQSITDISGKGPDSAGEVFLMARAFVEAILVADKKKEIDEADGSTS
jgi:hypothetical protein